MAVAPEYADQGEDYPDTPHSALSAQVGGTHYSDRAIQPIEYILANNLGFCEGNVVKYITRWKYKDGVKDLLKARHYIDFLLEEAEQSAS